MRNIKFRICKFCKNYRRRCGSEGDCRVFPLAVLRDDSDACSHYNPLDDFGGVGQGDKNKRRAIL